MFTEKINGLNDVDAKKLFIHQQCEAAVDEVLASVNTVQYLIKSISEITHTPFLRNRIKCVSLHRNNNNNNIEHAGTSENGISAGYMWRRTSEDVDKGDILLIEEHMVANSSNITNNITTTTNNNNSNNNNSIIMTRPDKKTIDTVERNLRHELIHAFDDARGFVESFDCAHQACSELRAARLSGDCFISEEIKKGRLDPLRSGMLCVRRRAILALEQNPICRGFSERSVGRVFYKCYSDYEPFAAPIYALGSYGEERFHVCGNNNNNSDNNNVM